MYRQDNKKQTKNGTEIEALLVKVYFDKKAF